MHSKFTAVLTHLPASSRELQMMDGKELHMILGAFVDELSMSKNQDGLVTLIEEAHSIVNLSRLQTLRQSSGRRMFAGFGSARIHEEDGAYLAMQETARLLVGQGMLAISGGGPGVMEAVHRGAVMATGASSDNGIFHGFAFPIQLELEEALNKWAEQGAVAALSHSFSPRKRLLIELSDAFVVAPGGWGTLEEMMQLLCAIQNGKKSVVPIVVVQGSNETFWEEWFETNVSALYDRGLISRDDECLIHIAADPEDAAQHIKDFYSVFNSCVRRSSGEFVLMTSVPLCSHALEQISLFISDAGYSCEYFMDNKTGTLHTVIPGTFPSRKLRLLIDLVNTYHKAAEIDAPK